MAAATQNNSPVNDYTFRALARAKTRDFKKLDDKPRGLHAFDTGALTVATTNIDDADDELFAFTFPAGGAYLVNLQVTATDLDTDESAALQFDVIAETSGGTETVLISNSTIGQAGGSDELDANGGHLLRDLSSQKLGFRVDTAAATPAAGTIRFKGLVWLGDLITVQ